MKLQNDKIQVELLDCTLRDGGYANNFQFTMRDTQNICSNLDLAGIKMIEVGHGMGIGVESPRLGVPFESDIDYLESARNATSNAKIGAFFIPGVGEKKKLKEVVENKLLDFFRIGVDVNDISQAKSVAEEILSKGVDVHINLMKTYALPVHSILEQLESFIGLDLTSIYVVDSAGCMLPFEVSEYVNELKNSGWNIGFHGHNNLQLANANCLSAINAGANLIDGTLSGMGRSAGNAQTEVLSWIIGQAGYHSNIDTFSLFETIEKYLKPIMNIPQGNDIMDIVIGMSKFHSGYLSMFKRAIGKYDINIYHLIQQVSEINCINPSEELIESIAKDLSRTNG